MISLVFRYQKIFKANEAQNAIAILEYDICMRNFHTSSTGRQEYAESVLTKIHTDKNPLHTFTERVALDTGLNLSNSPSTEDEVIRHAGWTLVKHCDPEFIPLDKLPAAIELYVYAHTSMSPTIKNLVRRRYPDVNGNKVLTLSKKEVIVFLSEMFQTAEDFNLSHSARWS